VHDLVVDDASLWASLPDQNRVSELELGDLDEVRRVLVGTSPLGMDLLDDGRLAIALNGATGYVELDPDTAALHGVTLPLLGAPLTRDVVNLGNDKVLVSAAGGQARLVRVDRSDGWSSARVANQRVISGARLAAAGTTVLVADAVRSRAIRLDGSDPALPVAMEAPMTGLWSMALSSDGGRAYFATGRVVTTSDLATVATIGAGYPVLDASGGTVYAVNEDNVSAFDTATLAAGATYDTSGCNLPSSQTDPITAVAMPSDTTIVVVAGTRICRIDLDLAPGPPVTPDTVDDPTPTPTTPRTTVTDLGTRVHDLLVDGGSLWATLPGRNRVSELELADLDELRRILVGTEPRGLDLLDVGRLAIALRGATGYVELDADTDARQSVTLPLLLNPQTWDVTNIGDDKALVSASSGFGTARLVRVDMSDAWSSSQVAWQRSIQDRPAVVHAGTTILVSSGSELYRLDSADPMLPVAAETGSLLGAHQLAITPDGGSVYVGSGEVFSTADLIRVGGIGAGYPVVDPTTGSTAFAVEKMRVTAFETETYSAIAQYDISGCGFPSATTDPITSVVMPTATTILATAGTRICRIDLDQTPGDPITPDTIDDPTPVQSTPRTTVTDLGTYVHDVVVNGDSVWTTLLLEDSVAELDLGDLDERRRVAVGTRPRGIDVLQNRDLAIALEGATGYVEFDPDTETLRAIDLATPAIWDVADIGNNKVLVSSRDPNSFIMRVDRSNGWSITEVADGESISDDAVFADAGTTILIGAGPNPNFLYRLDGTDSTLPIAAQNQFGNVDGTRQLTISADGARAYLGSGQVVRTSDLIPIGVTGEGFPVLDPLGTTAYSVGTDQITAFETTTFSAMTQFDISSCGFDHVIQAAVMPSDATIVVTSFDRVCRVDLKVLAPTIGSAVAAGSGRATVSWTAPAFDGGEPIVGYAVIPYVGFTPQQPRYFGSTATTQTITGLTNGTTYRFRVRAWTSTGASAPSKVSNPVVPAVGAPYPPSIGMAIAGDGTATVSWTTPSFDGGSPITGYVVTPYVGYIEWPSTTFNSSATTQTVTGLTNGKTYRFRVRAINAIGTSAYSKVTNPLTPSP
jgi:hypothetical protein